LTNGTGGNDSVWARMTLSLLTTGVVPLGHPCYKALAPTQCGASGRCTGAGCGCQSREARADQSLKRLVPLARACQAPFQRGLRTEEPNLTFV